MLGNAEFLWVESHDATGTVDLIDGSSIEGQQFAPEIWHHFAASECLQWHPEIPGCLLSTMQMGLTDEVVYRLVGWTEAADRRQPKRNMVLLTETWVFRPADINRDGVVDCMDGEWFAGNPYDWNLDGQITAGDSADLAAAVAHRLADLDGDDLINTVDLVLLLQTWGACAGATGQPCPGDLNCDGIVDVFDMLGLLSRYGS